MVSDLGTHPGYEGEWHESTRAPTRPSLVRSYSPSYGILPIRLDIESRCTLDCQSHRGYDPSHGELLDLPIGLHIPSHVVSAVRRLSLCGERFVEVGFRSSSSVVLSTHVLDSWNWRRRQFVGRAEHLGYLRHVLLVEVRRRSESKEHLRWLSLKTQKQEQRLCVLSLISEQRGVGKEPALLGVVGRPRIQAGNQVTWLSNTPLRRDW